MKTLFIFSFIFLFSCLKTNYEVDNSPSNNKIHSKRELEVLSKNNEDKIISPSSVTEHELTINIPKKWEKKTEIQNNKDFRLLYQKDDVSKIIIMSNEFEGTEDDLITISVNISIDLGATEITDFYKSNLLFEKNLYFSYAKLGNGTLMGIATVIIDSQGYLFFCIDGSKRLSECSSIIKTLKIGSKND